MGWLRKQKLEILKMEHNFSTKKMNLCLKWKTLRSYHFLVEVTFKHTKSVINLHGIQNKSSKQVKLNEKYIPDLHCISSSEGTSYKKFTI